MPVGNEFFNFSHSQFAIIIKIVSLTWMPTLFTMSATVHHNVCVSFGVRCPTMLDDDARSSLQLDISGFGKMQHTQMHRYRRDSIAICTNFGAYISMSEWMSEIYISSVYRLWLAFHVLFTFPWTKRYFHLFETQCRCEGGHSSGTIGKPKYGLLSAFYVGFFYVGTLTHIVDSYMLNENDPNRCQFYRLSRSTIDAELWFQVI